MKQAAFTLVAILALAGTPAFAADMPLKAPPPPAPVDTWTGFYVGGQLGGEWLSANWSAQCFGGSCPGAPPPPDAEVFAPDGSSPRGINPSSFRGGLYAGFNWQVQPTWVVGVEADVAWSNGTSSVSGLVGCSVIPQSCVPGHTTTTLGNDSTSIQTGTDGSIRGRLGFLATPTLLLYGTGGVTWEGVSATENCGSTLFGAGGAWCLALRNETNSTTLTGWTVGGGAEWKFAANWVARVEYRYSDYGNWQTSFFGNSPATGQPINVDFNSASIRIRTSVATVGLSYNFNWAGPLVMKP